MVTVEELEFALAPMCGDGVGHIICKERGPDLVSVTVACRHVVVRAVREFRGFEILLEFTLVASGEVAEIDLLVYVAGRVRWKDYLAFVYAEPSTELERLGRKIEMVGSAMPYLLSGDHEFIVSQLRKYRKHLQDAGATV